MVEPDRPQMVVWCMHFACWISKATDTHSICSTYWLSTAKLVTQICLSVLFVHTLPLLFHPATLPTFFY